MQPYKNVVVATFYYCFISTHLKGAFSLPANSATNSLSGAKLNRDGGHTEVETKEEKNPQGIKVGKQQAEPDQPDRDVGEEEGDANQEADGPACLSLVVAEGGDEQVGQGDGGCYALQAVLVQVRVEHCHVNLSVE